MIKALNTFNLCIDEVHQGSADYSFELMNMSSKQPPAPIYWIKTKEFVFTDRILLGRDLEKGEYLFGLGSSIDAYPQ